MPLIFRGPAGGGLSPARVEAAVSLLDVAPALLEWLGIPAPPQFQGHSLLRLLGPRSGVDDPVYAESMYARDHLGCSPLRSIRLGRYKFIEAPKPELYDLASDPGEKENRYEREPSKAGELRARLLSISNGERRPAGKPGSVAVMAPLRSLGYLGGAPTRPASGADPKDRLALYHRYGRAVRLASTGLLPEAIREFQQVLAEDGHNVLAHFYLAICYYRSRQLDDAVKALDATLLVSPDHLPAEELLATIWLLKKDYARARRQFTHVTAIAPQNYAAHYNLGILDRLEGRADAAAREWQAAARVDPSSAQPHTALASLYCEQGNVTLAMEEYRQAVALDPRDRESRTALQRGCAQKAKR